MDEKFKARMFRLVKRAGNAQTLADKAGLSRRVVGKYLAGESDPSRARLIALARAGGVRIEWLATGEGPETPPRDDDGAETTEQQEEGAPPLETLGQGSPPRLPPRYNENEPAISPPRIQEEQTGYLSPPSLNELSQEEAKRLLQELRLAELAVLARRGQQQGAWDIAVWLDKHGRPASLEDIRAGLIYEGIDPELEELAADLAVLLQKGTILSDGDASRPRYRLASPVTRLKAREVGDLSQALIQALRTLVNDIYPTALEDREKSYLLNLEANLPEDQAKLLLERLKGLIRELFSEANAETATEKSKKKAATRSSRTPAGSQQSDSARSNLSLVLGIARKEE